MDIAIVTGAETPLGLRIIQGLIRQGCRVHGIGNNFSKVTFADPNFFAHPIDVSDLEAVTRATNEILEKEGSLHILIHAIDVTPGAAFEKLPVGNLEAILKIGLLGPIMLTRLALPNLLRFRGQLINIIPANKSGHTASAINALIEGGLREMNTALFDQARDAGLRVTNLILRQNTELPAATVSDEQLMQTRIDPEHVARTIEQLLNVNEPNVPNEITLYPRLSAKAESALPEEPLPIDPYNAIVLPPAEYCPPEEPKIPTKSAERVERTIPYSDEEMEEKIAAAIEDFEAHPERYEAKKSAPQREQRPSDSQAQGEGGSKRRRGRRRGGRNRNRDQNNNREHSQEGGQTEAKPSAQPETSQTRPENADAPNKAPRNRRRRGGKKPQAAGETNSTPQNTETKPAQQSKESSPKPKTKAPKPKTPAAAKSESAEKPNANKPAPKLEQTPKPALADKPAKKKAVKKAVKKVATKKATVKKTATKKVAVKKAVTKKAVTKKPAKKKTAKKVAKPKE